MTRTQSKQVPLLLTVHPQQASQFDYPPEQLDPFWRTAMWDHSKGKDPITLYLLGTSQDQHTEQRVGILLFLGPPVERLESGTRFL